MATSEETVRTYTTLKSENGECEWCESIDKGLRFKLNERKETFLAYYGGTVTGTVTDYNVEERVLAEKFYCIECVEGREFYVENDLWW